MNRIWVKILLLLVWTVMVGAFSCHTGYRRAKIADRAQHCTNTKSLNKMVEAIKYDIKRCGGN